MIAAGEREIVECVVVAGGERLCTPCGGCRQRLAEFAKPDLPIHICGPDGFRQTFTLETLLPHTFSLDQPKTTSDAKSNTGIDAIVRVIRDRAPNLTPATRIDFGLRAWWFGRKDRTTGHHCL